MDKNIQVDDFPSNVPPKLIKMFIAEKRNYSALARRLSTPKFTMNKSYVFDLVKKGKEPKNPKIRTRLFLTRKYRKPLPEWVVQATAILSELEDKQISSNS